ncbi:MAG: hypothetical protein LBJ73_01455 [Rickettsiales bacterium]|jgi:hypothetical protein|nr:hypothetical protein [Rickettsiales bacterium]
MKKSTIVLALLVCAFAFHGAFAVITFSDITGDYEIDGATISTPEEDYDNGIYTTYNDGDQYLSDDTYGGLDVYFHIFPVNDDLEDHLLQSVCTSRDGAFAEVSCDISRTNQNDYFSNDAKNCWCRLKRIKDNLSPDGWVFSSKGSATYCAIYCANDCALEANRSSSFRSALLWALGDW